MFGGWWLGVEGLGWDEVVGVGIADEGWSWLLKERGVS